MPHTSLKLIPGVDQNRTATLNEAAISESQLIRFMPDRGGSALPQKFGGWEQFSPYGTATSVIALNTWLDLNAGKHVEAATTVSATVYDDLGNNPKNVTPYRYMAIIGVSATFSTTTGDADVTITDTSSNMTDYDAVVIATHVAVGGLVLYGSYPIKAVGANTYQISARDVLGNPVLATATTTAAAVASLDFVSGATKVTVTVTKINLSVGSTFTILVPYYSSGVLLYGDYIVQTVSSADTFTILASSPATATATVSINTNRVNLIYSVGAEPADQSIGYGEGGYGDGGYGSGVSDGGTRSVNVSSVAVAANGNALLYFSQQIWIPEDSYVSTQNIKDGGGATLFSDTTAQVVRGYITSTGSCIEMTGSATAGAAASGTVTIRNWRLTEDLLWPCTNISMSGVTNNGLDPTLGFYTATLNLPYVYTPESGTYLSVNGSGHERIYVLSSSTTGTTSSITVYNGTGSAILATSTGGTLQEQAPPAGDQVAATISVWGGSTLTCFRGGPIYLYDHLDGYNRLKNLPYAPQANEGAFVAMPQRQVVAYGSTATGIQDPLLVRWSDVQNLDRWVATPVDFAGSYRLSSGSRIVSGMQAHQQGLLWTDTSLWSMQFIGLPDVYSFNEVATGCGLIGQKAAMVMGGTAFWMGSGQFYSYGGEGIQMIPCPIWDVVFQQIDRDAADYVVAAANSRFSEIMWFYPVTGSGGVPTNYAKYNTAIQQWDYGTLTRTAWVDQSVFTQPLSSAGAGPIYKQESGLNANTRALASSFRTGFFALSDGDMKSFIDQVWPDMKWGLFGASQDAEVFITFHCADYAGGPETAYGPYSMTQTSPQYITPRIRARLVAIEISSADVDSFWRLGNIRYRIQQDGKF
jgi:hypothetical protein